MVPKTTNRERVKEEGRPRWMGSWDRRGNAFAGRREEAGSRVPRARGFQLSLKTSCGNSSYMSI